METTDSSQTVMLILYLHPSGDYTQMTAKGEVLILSQHCCSDMTFDWLFSGCGKLWVTDRTWKLTFPHGMFKVKVNECS